MVVAWYLVPKCDDIIFKKCRFEIRSSNIHGWRRGVSSSNAIAHIVMAYNNGKLVRVCFVGCFELS